jgi:hypothetical protein
MTSPDFTPLAVTDSLSAHHNRLWLALYTRMSHLTHGRLNSDAMAYLQRLFRNSM